MNDCRAILEVALCAMQDPEHYNDLWEDQINHQLAAWQMHKHMHTRAKEALTALEQLLSLDRKYATPMQHCS